MAEKTREDEIREFADNWYINEHKTEEEARAVSRHSLWQASLLERRDPSQCRLIRNRSRNALRGGLDPATIPDDMAARARESGALYAEIANRAPDYPNRSRHRELDNTPVHADRSKLGWDKETKELEPIDPEEWCTHWIRGKNGWRNHWQDIEDPREGALARSRYYLEMANSFAAYAKPESGAAGRAEYCRKLSELHTELADKLPKQEYLPISEKTAKSVYDEAVADGWDPADWLGSNPKEQALENARRYREILERVESGHPAAAEVIENWRKGTLLRGEDPETAVSKCIAHLRKMATVFAEIAERVSDAAGQIKFREEVILRNREKTAREHQEVIQTRAYTIYDKYVKSGEIKPREWYLNIYEPEEQARYISRQHYAAAERLVTRVPTEIGIIYKNAERIRDDPERLINMAITHLRELGEVYSTLADDAPKYSAEIKAGEDERHAQYRIERSWRSWLELYNMRDGLQFRAALAERVRGSLLYALRKGDSKRAHLLAEYANRLEREHSALAGGRPVSFRFDREIGWFPVTGWFPY